MATNAAILVTNLATGILAARALAPAGRGVLAALLVWPQLVGLLAALGLPTSLVYHYRAEPARSSQTLWAALILGLAQASVAAVVTANWIIPRALGQYGVDVIDHARAFMLFSLTSVVGYNVLSILEARGEFARRGIVMLSSPVITLLSLAALATSHRLDPLSAGIAYLLPQIVITSIVLSQLIRLHRPTVGGLLSSVRRLQSYGLRSYSLDLVGVLGSNIDAAIVTALLGPVALGLYVVAFRATRMLNLLSSSVSPVLFATGVGMASAAVMSRTGRAARFNLAATGLMACGLAIVAPFLLQVIYGPAFLDAVTVFRLLLFEVVLASTTVILIQVFLALGRPGTVSLLQGTGVLLLVILLFLLVPRYGIVGAGFALLVASAFRLILTVASCPLVFGIRPPSLFIRLQDIRWARRAFQH